MLKESKMNIQKVYNWVDEQGNREIHTYDRVNGGYISLDCDFCSVEEAEQALDKYTELTQFDWVCAYYTLVQSYKVEK
jgi:hypothetical protein